jgi:hypothetical protein
MNCRANKMQINRDLIGLFRRWGMNIEIGYKPPHPSPTTGIYVGINEYMRKVSIVKVD